MSTLIGFGHVNATSIIDPLPGHMRAQHIISHSLALRSTLQKPVYTSLATVLLGLGRVCKFLSLAASLLGHTHLQPTRRFSCH